MVERDKLQKHERIQLAKQVVQKHNPLPLGIESPLLYALLPLGNALVVVDVCCAAAAVVVGVWVWVGNAAAALARPRGLGLIVHCAARQGNAQLLRSSRHDKEELSACESQGEGEVDVAPGAARRRRNNPRADAAESGEIIHPPQLHHRDRRPTPH